MLNKIISWAGLFLWMYVIFWMSDQTRVVPVIDPILAQLISIGGHIVFYAILYLLSENALRRSFSLNNQVVNLLSLLIVFIYGISDEWHQSFVPGRDPSAIDAGLDLIGGLLASKFYFFGYVRNKKNRKTK